MTEIEEKGLNPKCLQRQVQTSPQLQALRKMTDGLRNWGNQSTEQKWGDKVRPKRVSLALKTGRMATQTWFKTALPLVLRNQ